MVTTKRIVFKGHIPKTRTTLEVKGNPRRQKLSTYEIKPQKIGSKTGGTLSYYISLLKASQINDAGFDHQQKLPNIQGFVKNESFRILTLYPKCLLSDPGGAAQQNKKRLVTVSNLSDILQSTFERPNQWAPDAIRSKVYNVVHHKYSDLCLQKEQCMK